MDIANKNFRLYFPNSNVYIMRDHNWAFAAWEIEKLTGKIKQKATLLHVDSHSDYLDPVEFNTDIVSVKEAMKIAEQIKIDEFIQAGEMTKTIGEIYMISDENWDDDYTDIKRAYTLNHFENCFRKDFFNRYEEKDYILDLDLDFYNTNAHSFISMNWDSNPHLYSDEFILGHMKKLKEINDDWKVITISISPEHCGGIEAATHLYKLALESFGLSENEGLKW